MTVIGNLSRLNFLIQINAGPLFAVAMRRRAKLSAIVPPFHLSSNLPCVELAWFCC